MSRRKQNSGYTLLEIIFASAIMGISASLLVSVSYNLRNFERNEQQQNEIERESTLALDYMARDIKSAAAIEPLFPSDNYHPNILVLKIPEYDEDGEPVTGAFDYVSYRVIPERESVVRALFDDENGVDLKAESVLPVGPSNIQCLVDGVPWESIISGGNALNIDVTVSRSASKNNYSRTLSISATLRNPSA